MGRQVGTILYIVAMVAVIVGVDVLFFRDHFWPRLMVNIGVVLVFVASTCVSSRPDSGRGLLLP